MMKHDRHDYIKFTRHLHILNVKDDFIGYWDYVCEKYFLDFIVRSQNNSFNNYSYIVCSNTFALSTHITDVDVNVF